MTRTHGQIRLNAVLRRLHLQTTITQMTFLIPQTETHAKLLNFDQDRSMKTHTTNRSPMTVEPHQCPPANEIMTPPKETNKTENNDRMNEDLSLALPDTQPTCPNVTKLSDLISTEADAERDHDKQGKKREKSKHTKEETHEYEESEDNITEAGNTQFTQTSSPKRTKKIKVDRDGLKVRERTRSQSRMKNA